MTEGTVEMVMQEPFLKTFLVEHMQTFEFVDFLGSQDGIETDGAGMSKSKFMDLKNLKKKERK